MGDGDVGSLSTVPGKGPHAEALYGADLSVGAQVGPYLIEARAGRGGFATVYRARPAGKDGDPVAVKVLHQALVQSRHMLMRFEREIESLRRVRHASIVPLIDVGGLVDGRPYYVMPWLGGRSLETYLGERGALSPQEAVHIVRELGRALMAAHGEGVVHRDVKPSNVMLLSEEPVELRLLDFGIAKIVADDTTGRHDLTSTGNRLGTPHYMAPEQISGKQIDARADVYALGILFYQLVTGQLPFTAPTPIEVEAKHLYAPPPRASDAAGTPPALDEVIVRCLAKKPSDRYSSVAELIEGAEAAVRTGSAEPAPVVEPALGIHVEARLCADDLDAVEDEAFDALEDVIDAAQATCGERGYAVAVAGGTSFLAVRSTASGDEHAARRAAVDLAFAVVTHASRDVALTVSIHAGGAEIARDGGELDVRGGELLRLAEWVAPAGATEVLVTASAAAGIESELTMEPAGPRLHRVRRRA